MESHSQVVKHRYFGLVVLTTNPTQQIPTLFTCMLPLPYCINSVDSVHHSALRFITNSLFLTHHYFLYDLVSWPSLSIRRQQHCYVFIYKALLGKLPSYLCIFLLITKNFYNPRSTRWLRFQVPRIYSEFCQAAFSYNAPWSWNKLVITLKLNDLVSLNEFKI